MSSYWAFFGNALSSPHSGGYSAIILIDRIFLVLLINFLPRIAGVTLGVTLLASRSSSSAFCFLPRIAGVTLMVNSDV